MYANAQCKKVLEDSQNLIQTLEIPAEFKLAKSRYCEYVLVARDEVAGDLEHTRHGGATLVGGTPDAALGLLEERLRHDGRGGGGILLLLLGGLLFLLLLLLLLLLGGLGE